MSWRRHSDSAMIARATMSPPPLVHCQPAGIDEPSGRAATYQDSERETLSGMLLAVNAECL